MTVTARQYLKFNDYVVKTVSAFSILDPVGNVHLVDDLDAFVEKVKFDNDPVLLRQRIAELEAKISAPIIKYSTPSQITTIPLPPMDGECVRCKHLVGPNNRSSADGLCECSCHRAHQNLRSKAVINPKTRQIL